MYFLQAESERILLPAASIATVALSAIFSPPTATDRGRVAGGNSAEFVRRLLIKVTPFQLVAAIQLIIRTGVIVLGICFSLGKPLIAGYRPRKISIAVRHRPDFPIAELLCCRQVDVDEIWIAAVEAERSRACRDLRPVGDLVKLDAIDDVRRQVPVVASITQRKNDCHLVDALDIPGSEGAVLFGDPADRDRRPKHFLQGQRLQSGSARAIGLEPRQWIWLQLCLRCAYSDVDQSVAWSSTSLNQRNRDI